MTIIPFPIDESTPFLRVRMGCGHFKLYRAAVPRRNEKVWCATCQDLCRVVIRYGVWGWGCRQCKAGRSYGLVRHTCASAATKHAQATGHVVAMGQEGMAGTTVTVRPEGDTSEIPF